MNEPTKNDKRRPHAGFTAFDPGRNDVAASLSVRHLGDDGESVRSFKVTLRDGAGAHLRDAATPEVFAVSWTKDTDTLDLAPYFERGGQLYMAVCEQLRPCKSTRNESAIHAGAPAGIVRSADGEISFDRSAARILEKKVGVQVVGPLETLGGSYLPSVGHSSELGFARAIEIEPPEELDRVRVGVEFAGRQRVRFETLTDILGKFLAGEYQDTRLALLAFRLADAKGIPVELALELPRPKNPPLSAAALARIADARRLRELVSDVSTEPGRVSSIDVEYAPTVKSTFVAAKRIEVQNLDRDARPLGKPYMATCIERAQRDSVDFGAYFGHDGEIYMVIKRGVRPAVAVRDQSAHFFHTELAAIQWEGIAGSLPNDLDTVTKRTAHAETELAEEVGLEVAAMPHEVGSDFPSPGYCNEKVFRYLGPVDPEPRVQQHQGIDETVNIAYVEVNELLRLGREGLIRDPRLLLNAHLIKAGLRYKGPPDPAASLPKPDVAAFEAMINEGSSLHAWLVDNVPSLHNDLSRTPYYRKLIYYCQNELGLVAMRFEHELEVGLFSRYAPIFAVPHHKSADYMPLNLMHDLRHYTQGDMNPWRRNANGDFVMMPWEEYHRGLDGDEADATCFSDITIPHKAGLKVIDDIVGGTSTARAFLEMGYGEKAACHLLRTIEFDGYVPQELLKHPRFSEFEDLLIGRYLRYHVLDSRHTRAAYENWRHHQELASVLVRFCNAFDSIEAYEAHREQSLKDVLNYSEGANPLRAFLGRTMNVDLRVIALSLAYLSEKIAEHGGPGAADVRREIVASVSQLHAQLLLVRERSRLVKDTELNASNLDAFNVARAARAVVDKVRVKYASWSTDTNLLKTSDIDLLRGREMPFFDHITFSKEGVDQELAGLVRSSYLKAGLSIPEKYEL